MAEHCPPGIESKRVAGASWLAAASNQACYFLAVANCSPLEMLEVAERTEHLRLCALVAL
ncbi:MAG TPA: hypothetical protein DD423_07165 [Opitutae bacterium]|nr:hypothetical protein [Opitutae bacterium]